MSNDNVNVKDSKKGIRIFLVILAFVFFFVSAIAVLPVVVPMLFGLNEYVVEEDNTESISMPLSIVYTDSTAKTSLAKNDLVAIDSDDNKKVELYTVLSNSIGEQTITLNNNDVVSYSVVKGNAYATVPFAGALTQFCNTGFGIALIVVLFAIGVALAIIAPKIDTKQE